MLPHNILCRDIVWPGQEFSVAIEEFSVATELATTESSITHDRARCVKASTCDSVHSRRPAHATARTMSARRMHDMAWASSDSAQGACTTWPGHYQSR